MSKGFKDLLQKVYECDRKTVAVAVAEDEPVLEAVKAAKEKGIADAILVGYGFVGQGAAIPGQWLG